MIRHSFYRVLGYNLSHLLITLCLAAFTLFLKPTGNKSCQKNNTGAEYPGPAAIFCLSSLRFGRSFNLVIQKQPFRPASSSYTLSHQPLIRSMVTK